MRPLIKWDWNEIIHLQKLIKSQQTIKRGENYCKWELHHMVTPDYTAHSLQYGAELFGQAMHDNLL